MKVRSKSTTTKPNVFFSELLSEFDNVVNALAIIAFAIDPMATIITVEKFAFIIYMLWLLKLSLCDSDYTTRLYAQYGAKKSVFILSMKCIYQIAWSIILRSQVFGIQIIPVQVDILSILKWLFEMTIKHKVITQIK